MRKILCFFLALTMLIPLTACRKNTAADENILQNLYTQVTDEPLVESMDAIPSNVVFADGKYYVFSREDNREAYFYDKTADAYEEKSYYIVMDENGAVSEAIPLALQSVNGQTLTERGLFAIPFENGENRFRWFDLTGAVLAEVSLDGIRPNGGPTSHLCPQTARLPLARCRLSPQRTRSPCSGAKSSRFMTTR